MQNDEVEQTAIRFMQELGYRGALDIDIRYDARDGRYKVNDVNPRVGGMLRLFVGENGIDVARALYQDMTGQAVVAAKPHDGRVRLSVTAAGGAGRELDCDHVIAATGYRTDLTRLTFLSAAVRSGLRTLAGSPVVGRDYQSSVPGLSFVGTAVAPTMGPVMRFVYGTRHAAPAVARQVAAVPGRKAAPAEAVSR